LLQPLKNKGIDCYVNILTTDLGIKIFISILRALNIWGFPNLIYANNLITDSECNKMFSALLPTVNIW